jgi:hypothetical protein
VLQQTILQVSTKTVRGELLADLRFVQAIGAMVKIDDAVIQLTEREGLLSWLYTILQHTTLSTESHQAVTQILEDVVLILNRKEERRRSKIRALPDGDKSSIYVPRRWVSELCSCIELMWEQSGTPHLLVSVCSLLTCTLADLPRLRSLSETLLRVALANPELDTTYTVTVLTAKLRQLDLDDDLTKDADWIAVVHALCRCGLLWTEAVDAKKAVVVMHSLTARAIALDDDMSRWLIWEWKASRTE